MKNKAVSQVVSSEITQKANKKERELLEVSFKAGYSVLKKDGVKKELWYAIKNVVDTMDTLREKPWSEDTMRKWCSQTQTLTDKQLLICTAELVKLLSNRKRILSQEYEAYITQIQDNQTKFQTIIEHEKARTP